MRYQYLNIKLNIKLKHNTITSWSKSSFINAIIILNIPKRWLHRSTLASTPYSLKALSWEWNFMAYYWCIHVDPLRHKFHFATSLTAHESTLRSSEHWEEHETIGTLAIRYVRSTSLESTLEPGVRTNLLPQKLLIAVTICCDRH